MIEKVIKQFCLISLMKYTKKHLFQYVPTQQGLQLWAVLENYPYFHPQRVALVWTQIELHWKFQSDTSMYFLLRLQ